MSALWSVGSQEQKFGFSSNLLYCLQLYCIEKKYVNSNYMILIYMPAYWIHQPTLIYFFKYYYFEPETLLPYWHELVGRSSGQRRKCRWKNELKNTHIPLSMSRCRRGSAVGLPRPSFCDETDSRATERPAGLPPALAWYFDKMSKNPLHRLVVFSISTSNLLSQRLTQKRVMVFRLTLLSSRSRGLSINHKSPTSNADKTPPRCFLSLPENYLRKYMNN